MTYAGGGGGGGYTGGAGGAGGGGAGALQYSTAGTANTGGGGGGDNYANGSAGGSGIVVLRYPDFYIDATSTTGSPTYTVTGGYKIYKWISTGTWSITF